VPEEVGVQAEAVEALTVAFQGSGPLTIKP
jgi:hypothetical protein